MEVSSADLGAGLRGSGAGGGSGLGTRVKVSGVGFGLGVVFGHGGVAGMKGWFRLVTSCWWGLTCAIAQAHDVADLPESFVGAGPGAAAAPVEDVGDEGGGLDWYWRRRSWMGARCWTTPSASHCLHSMQPMPGGAAAFGRVALGLLGGENFVEVEDGAELRGCRGRCGERGQGR